MGECINRLHVHSYYHWGICLWDQKVFSSGIFKAGRVRVFSESCVGLIYLLMKELGKIVKLDEKLLNISPEGIFVSCSLSGLYTFPGDKNKQCD